MQREAIRESIFEMMAAYSRKSALELTEETRWRDKTPIQPGLSALGPEPNDLGFDSLNLVEIEMDLETIFDIKIEEGELDGKDTLGALIDHIVTKLPFVAPS